MVKLPISASVVCYNEGHLLPKCLNALSFCEEIIVIDLGSSDNSIKIAKQYANKIYHKERNPIVEVYKIWIQDQAAFPWILYVDPDEILDETLKDDIIDIFSNENEVLETCGTIGLPWQFYFREKQLKGIWGYISTCKRVLIHKDRTYIKPFVHHGIKILPEFKTYIIPRKSSNVLHHYWMTSYKLLFIKHLSYLKKVEARYNKGMRTSLKQIFLSPYRSFKDAYFRFKGYKDGITGLFLSVFWSWYQTSALIRLWQFQKRQKIK